MATGYFDADFFLYREDADLAWRLRNLGWRSLYVPSAVAHHRRRNLPERVNNQSGSELLRTFVPTFARDLVVLGACLTVERSSLPAFGWLWTNRKRLWAKRKEIQAKVVSRRKCA